MAMGIQRFVSRKQQSVSTRQHQAGHCHSVPLRHQRCPLSGQHTAACRKHRMAVSRSASTDTQVSSTGAAQDENVIPAGCARYSISIKKPLGIVLEQNKETMIITIAEVNPTGNAAKTGLVAVGDQLIATSGVTYTREDDYAGAKVKNGQKVVRMNVLGQPFKTVSAAIGSHPGHMAVTLEFQRCGEAS